MNKILAVGSSTARLTPRAAVLPSGHEKKMCPSYIRSLCEFLTTFISSPFPRVTQTVTFDDKNGHAQTQKAPETARFLSLPSKFIVI